MLAVDDQVDTGYAMVTQASARFLERFCSWRREEDFVFLFFLQPDFLFFCFAFTPQASMRHTLFHTIRVMSHEGQGKQDGIEGRIFFFPFVSIL